MKKILFLMMGGSGTRLGSALPKQFLPVGGSAIYQFILDLYARAVQDEIISIDRVVLINNREWRAHLEDALSSFASELPFTLNIVDGGSTRSESIKNGVTFLSKELQEEAIVLIHDATHPYLDADATKKLCLLLESGKRAATLVTHVWDTVYLVKDERVSETLPRACIGVGASPEGFSFQFLKEMFLSDKVDINQFTSAGNYAETIGEPIGTIWSSILNLKITYPDDLAVFQQAHPYFSGKSSK